MIYFDNAATSFPKPPCTIEAMVAFQKEVGGSPGRSGHRVSITAGQCIYEAREAISRLFNVPDPLRIVFTKNATESLNMALLGILKPGEHVITSGLEHNSVMRPLRFLENRGVRLTIIPTSPAGKLEPLAVKEAICPKTRMVVMTHASNVLGVKMPVGEVGEVLRPYPHVLFLVDAAQTAGSLPIDVRDMNIDLLAFTGHKSLFGPQGTGGLYIREGLEDEIDPLMRGGTGSRSEWEEQPAFMPDKFESGTPNTVGIAGLRAGVEFVLEESVDKIRKREEGLLEKFLVGLEELGDGVRLYGPRKKEDRIPVVSFNLPHLLPSAVAQMLDERWGIMCRPGLHCAPAAHLTAGTFPQGTVRFSFGYFNTDEEVEIALRALKEIINGRS